MIAFFTAPVVVGGGLLLLGGAYILNNPQTREVVRDLPKHLPSLLNNLNPFRVDPLANGEARQPERFPKRTPVDGVGGVGGFNDGERVYLPNNTGHPRSSGIETGTRPFPGNVSLSWPRVETFPNCYDPLLSPPFFQSNSDGNTPSADFETKPLQHAFTRGHASDFGITGNWNKTNAEEFKKVLLNHIDNAPEQIPGTFRWKKQVTHYFDPDTNLWAAVDADGKFVAGWKLSDAQVNDLLTKGNVW